MGKEYYGSDNAHAVVNGITTSRGIASLGTALTLGTPISYVLAGYAVLSDIADGAMARKFNVGTFQGSIKDNLSDLCMFNAVEALVLLNIDKALSFPGVYDKIFTGAMAGVLVTTFLLHSVPNVIDALKRNAERNAFEKGYEEWAKVNSPSLDELMKQKNI